MKVVFWFILFPFVIRAEHIQSVYPHPGGMKKQNTDDGQRSTPLSIHIVRKSWLETDQRLRAASEKLIHSLLPYAFNLFTTAELTPDCGKDMVNVLRGISETKLWAFKMVDSFGKLPTGILGGTVSTLGDYIGCLNVSAKNLFIGKYCLVDLEIPLPEQSNFHQWKQDNDELFNPTNNNTIVNEFMALGEKLYMLHPRTSICIPSTCTTEDAQNLAKSAIHHAGLQFNTNVKSCETKQDVIEVTFLDLTFMLLLFSIALIVLLATTVDFYQRITSDISCREEEGLGWLLSFSIFINAGRLTKKDVEPDSIRIFHGIRVITMIWLIFFHVTALDRPQPFGGLKRYFELTTTFAGQLAPSGLLAVETFFFMSSTLLAYHIVKAAEQKISVGFIFTKRYLRMTIPHLMMIAITTLLPFMGSGPLYKEIVGKEAQNCKERGWMNLLYINNFLPMSEICMQNTWYLAVDTQLFILGVLVILPFRKNPRAAIVCIVALFCCGELGTLISHILYNLPPTMLTINVQMGYIEDLFRKSYFLPHFHLPTYCIGLLVGYFLALRKYVRVSLKVNLILWTAALSIMFTIIFGTYVWNKGTEFPGVLPSILFGCTHRVLWSLSLAWITIACQSDHGGIISKFLGSERFVILSRLTFMAYLTNLTIKYLYLGSTLHIIIYNLNVMVNMFLSIMVATFLASFVATLFFEAPFTNLEKALVVKLKERKISKGY